MKKLKIIFFIILFGSFFYSCTTLKKGFESQRKNSTDEFLVEKKQPLVMPPDLKNYLYQTKTLQIINKKISIR